MDVISFGNRRPPKWPDETVVQTTLRLDWISRVRKGFEERAWSANIGDHVRGHTAITPCI